jgi:hypothetical protein
MQLQFFVVYCEQEGENNMKSRKRLLGCLLLICSYLLSSCVQETLVRQPSLSLQLTAPATVYLYWLSTPHNRLEQAQTFTTDSEGKLRLEQLIEDRTAYPLMLHGVPVYEHSVCIEAQGYRTLVMFLRVVPGDDLRLSVPLSAGESLGVCQDYSGLRFHGGQQRPDIAVQHEHIEAAYEVTELR